MTTLPPVPIWILALIAPVAVGLGVPGGARTGGGAAAIGPSAEFDESLYGLSGALRIRTALPGESLLLPLSWAPNRPQNVRYRWVAQSRSGDAALGQAVPVGASLELPRDGRVVVPAEPGVYALELETPVAVRMDRVRVAVLTPFEEKKAGRIRGYAIGTYPYEGTDRGDRYAPPAGFLEVPAELVDLRVSEHLTLGEFLTHDQRDHWPKYVALDTRLLDKLELVLSELTGAGVRAERVVVMSGYRTPQYNRRGLDSGRASLSRHQYGDAADVWIDNDGDWYMDDLDGDGRRDTRDARVMLGAVEMVERRFPALVGGAGIYPDNGAHGPFIHIDVRGEKARW